MALTAEIEAMHELLRQHLDNPVLRPLAEDLMQKQFQALVGKISNSRYNKKDMASLVAAVSKGPWLAHQTLELVKTINQTEDSQKSINGTQRFVNASYFLTQKIVADLTSENVGSERLKMQHLINYLLGRLALRHPDETTFQHVVATFLALAHPKSAEQLPHETLMIYVREFKNMYRSSRNGLDWNGSSA